MEIRHKHIIRLFSLILGIAITVLPVIQLMQTQILSWHGWMLLICIPYSGYIFFFIGPGTRIVFSEKDIKVNFIILIGSFKIFEKKGRCLPWQEVGNVFSYFPIWLPFKAIGVLGFQNQKRRMFFLGTLTTKKKESLVYVGDHVSPEAIDEDVQRLIEKYRRQLQTQAFPISCL